MKFCQNVVINKIKEQIAKMEGNKLILRVESFQNAEFYLELYRYFEKYCETKQMEFVAKLTLGAFEKLKEQPEAKFFVNELLKENVVDEKNRITFYRNEIAERKKVILFLGTEYAEDKAGLNELFLINPIILEEVIEKQYHLIFAEYQEIMMEQEKRKLDHFYQELFSYVARDYIHLSDIVDQLPRNIQSFEELMQILCERLYKDWGFPNFMSFPIGKLKEKGKIPLLEKANQFYLKSKLKSKTDIKKAYAKIEKYKECHEECEKNWVPSEEFPTFAMFEECLRAYIRGIDVEVNRERLCKLDFMLISEILDLKISKSSQKRDTVIKLYDEPFLMLSKAVCYAVSDMSEVEYDNIEMEVTQIGLAGIYGEEEQDDTVQNEQELWEKVCRYAGGVISFFNTNGYLGAKRNCCIEIKQDLFDKRQISEFIEEGVMKTLSSSNTLSKVKFVLRIKNGAKAIGETKFEWKFSEQDGWVNTFGELNEELFSKVYEKALIPFGVIENIEAYTSAKSMEEFYLQLPCSNICYENLVPLFMQRYGTEYPELSQRYKELGIAFENFCLFVDEYGFFSALQKKNIFDNVLEAYKEVGNYMANMQPDSGLFEDYKLFLNSFLLAGNTSPIQKDLEIDRCIVPAYHPATLEKIKEKIDFIQEGENEIYRLYFEEQITCTGKEMESKLDFYHQISYINSSVDLLKGKNGCLSTKKMFYGYGVFDEEQGEKNHFRGSSLQSSYQKYGVDYDADKFGQMSMESGVMLRYIKEYIATFPATTGDLKIGVIPEKNLQPVISSIYYITKYCGECIENLSLYLYLKTEQQNEKKWMMDWLEKSFEEESVVKVQVYIKQYEKESRLEGLLREQQLDLIFLDHVLTQKEVSFSNLDFVEKNYDLKFPMFCKPLPRSYKSVKREIELSQTQFSVSSIHTRVMYKSVKQIKKPVTIQPIVTQIVCMEEEKWRLVEQLHKSAKWIVCMDVGLDKHVLFNSEEQSDKYKMIGFSTGEGTYGEYNVTVSAREEMILDLKTRIKRKLTRIFGRWDAEQLEVASKHCIGIAKELDGSSLMKALNPKDYDMNNFLAYVLTNAYTKIRDEKNEQPYEYKVMISLDSYKHWFRNMGGKLEHFPDFLELTVEQSKPDEEKRNQRTTSIMAKLIECKIAYENEERVEKAKKQICSGYAILKQMFDPNSQSVQRRYWYSQLYRVLVFQHINYADNDSGFTRIANDMLGVLDGNFTIQWSGEIYTFWLNRDMEKEERIILTDISEIPVEQVVFGQQLIKEMLTGKSTGEICAFEPIIEEKEELLLQEEEEMPVPPLQMETIENLQEEREQEHIDEKNSEIVEQKVEDTKKEVNTEMKVEEQKKQIEILLGTSKLSGENISWNYTNKAMANRHLLITGKSGQGKTYAIQCLLMECSKAQISSVIFDYTEGFTTKKLDEVFRKNLEGNIRQNIIKIKKMPINPFKRHNINIEEIIGKEMLSEMSNEDIAMYSKEDSVAVASRLASIFCHGYSFGDQQSATIYQACKKGIDLYGDKMNFELFRELLGKMENKEAKTVLNKLTPFLDTALFDTEGTMDWSEMLYNQGMVNVIQLTQIPRDMQIAATEFILWDMWYYSLLNGEEEKPFVVVLDEAQNLDFGEKSPSNKILTEGRKFGWSGWFATQFLKGQLKEDEIGRLQQTSQRIYFRPPDNEITSMAASIDQDRAHAAEWINKLKKLKKGNCIVTGDSLFGEHGQKLMPLQISISSLQER